MRFFHPFADHLFDLFHLRGQCVAVVGIFREAFRADKSSAPVSDCDTDGIAEFIWLAGLALSSNALDRRFMHAVDLVLVVPMLGMVAMRRFE
jgi:hypothetical protein